VRPQACLPWDDPIRVALGLGDDGTAYTDFVDRAGVVVYDLASRLGVEVEELPAKLHRPTSTPAKLIDEYLWVKITRSL
jgi:hypothetical protein